MNLIKINLWVVGLCLVFAGGTTIYLESYKNNQTIDIAGYLLMFAGWVFLFMKATEGTIIDAPKIPFDEDNAGFFKQRISMFFAYATCAGAVLGSLLWLRDLGFKRLDDILQNRPTNTVVAIVDHIDERSGRSSTSYYAVFQYTVNGKLISHSRYEKREYDFLVGQRFEIRYSVEHPEMFVILNQLK
jgi:hypothetical protein